MNKKLLSFLAICSLMSFSSCTMQITNTSSLDDANSNSIEGNSSTGTNVNSNTDSSFPVEGDTMETALLGHIPQDMEFRNKKYKMITEGFLELKNIELDSLIAYFINQKDYDMYISANSDIEYCVDKTNNIYYAFGEDMLLIYSIFGYSINDLIAVTFPEGGGSPLLFMSIEF